MKKFICFVGVCVLCAMITTACTGNEIKDEQKVSNSVEDIVEDVEEQEENDVAVEVKGEHFIINKELFRQKFNFIASNIDDIQISKIENWEHEVWEFEGNKNESYLFVNNEFSIELLKNKGEQNFNEILVDDMCSIYIYDSEEIYNKLATIIYIVATICENSNSSEKFKSDILKAFDNAIDTQKNQYVYSEKIKYCFSYDDEIKTMTFCAVPSLEEEQTSTENSEEPEKEISEVKTMINEEPQNNVSEQDTQEQKIIAATKKVFGEENYINVFYEPDDNFVLIKAKGKDLLSSSMTAKGMLKSIKDTLYEIREIPDLNVDFNIVYTMVNSAGDTSDDIVVKATYNNETRSSINWDEYVLHEDMPKIADEWWVHPAIQTALEK